MFPYRDLPTDAPEYRRVRPLLARQARKVDVPLPLLRIERGGSANVSRFAAGVPRWAVGTRRQPTLRLDAKSMAKLDDTELSAAISHELGHLKERKIGRARIAASRILGKVGFVVGAGATASLVSLPSVLTGAAALYGGSLATSITRRLTGGASRRAEHRMDAIAARSMGTAEPLQSALEKLIPKSVSHVAIDHPSLKQRLEHLDAVDRVIRAPRQAPALEL